MTELKVEQTLKDKQKEAICSFVNGRDCFVILPTGYGKTLLLVCSVTVRFRSPSWKDKVFNCDLRFAFNFFDDGPSKKVFTTMPGNTICWSSYPKLKRSQEAMSFFLCDQA